MTIGYAHSKLIARLRALDALTDADIASIERLPIRLQNFGAGHDIVREGDVVQQCCAVADGYLFRHKVGPEGVRQIVSWHIPGDVPDLYSLHLNPMDHNITTLGPAIVGFIPHEPLKEMLQRSPALTHVFWRETLVDAAAFRELVVSLGKRDALARIAHMICELLTRLQAVGLGLDMSYQFPASQVDVADATGMTPVHANRMIQQLRARGLIEWEGPRIRILDLAQLKVLAEFDEGYLHLRPSH
jgi:CRP-like cAMP-binding protein